MSYKLGFFFPICLITGCSGEHKLDTPKDIEDKKIERSGKLFGDLELRLPSSSNTKDKKKEEKTEK